MSITILRQAQGLLPDERRAQPQQGLRLHRLRRPQAGSAPAERVLSPTGT